MTCPVKHDLPSEARLNTGDIGNLCHYILGRNAIHTFASYPIKRSKLNLLIILTKVHTMKLTTYITSTIHALHTSTNPNCDGVNELRMEIIYPVCHLRPSVVMTGVLIGERVPLIIFGTAKVKRVRISAFLSGLKLEAEICNVHASATHKERVKGRYIT